MRFLSTHPFPFTTSPTPAVVLFDDNAVPPRDAGLVPLDERAHEALVAAGRDRLEELEFNRANRGLPPLTEAAKARVLAVPPIAEEPATVARAFDLRGGGRGLGGKPGSRASNG